MLWKYKSTMKTILFGIALSLLFCFLQGIPPAQAANAVGKFTLVEGRVDILRHGKLPSMKASLAELVYAKDVVRTRSSARAEVVFVDGNILRLAQRSKIDISEYITEETNRKEIITLQRGKIETIIRKDLIKRITISPDAYRFEVHTPNAVTGVRGTDYFLSFSDNISECYVRNGRVDTYNPKFPDKVVSVKAGNITSIPDNRSPEPARPASQAEIKAFEDAIGTYPESSAKNEAVQKPAAVSAARKPKDKGTEQCRDGYEMVAGDCLPLCGPGMKRDKEGRCVSKKGCSCPEGLVCNDNDECIAPFDEGYSGFITARGQKENERSENVIDQTTIDRSFGGGKKGGKDNEFSSAGLDDDLTNIATGCKSDEDCPEGYACDGYKCTKTEKSTPPAEPSGTDDPPEEPGTETAASTGIDIDEVGTAPQGKSRIVDGQLVPVENWPVNIAGMTLTLTGASNQTTTSDQSGKFSFNEIPAGDYTISVKEWDYGMTSQKFTAPSGKAIKITLKGSCPYLYVWTGQEYERENDIFSVARIFPAELMSKEGRMLARKDGLFLQRLSVENLSDELIQKKAYMDYYQIKGQPAVDSMGNYRLRVREQANERSFSDYYDLKVADHSPEVTIGITRNGTLLAFSSLHETGWQEMDGPAAVYNEDVIEVSLPPEAFEAGIVAIEWQGFQDGSAEGHSNAFGIKPRISLQRKDPDGQWQIMDWAWPRDEKDQSFFILHKKETGWDADGTIRLVATSCHAAKYHRIDRVSWAENLTTVPELRSLELVSAVTSTGGQVRQALLKPDGETVFLGPEDEITLKFSAPEIEQGMKRSFFFVSKGVYIPMPGLRIAER
jgi:hypothetical protein